MPETLSEPVEAEPSEILPEAFLPAVPDEALSPPALDDFLPEAEPSAFSEALPLIILEPESALDLSLALLPFLDFFRRLSENGMNRHPD